MQQLVGFEMLAENSGNRASDVFKRRTSKRVRMENLLDLRTGDRRAVPRVELEEIRTGERDSRYEAALYAANLSPFV